MPLPLIPPSLSCCGRLKWHHELPKPICHRINLPQLSILFIKTDPGLVLTTAGLWFVTRRMVTSVTVTSFLPPLQLSSAPTFFLLWELTPKLLHISFWLLFFLLSPPFVFVSHFLLLSALFSDDPIRLRREVVLLTDDRNLRVKALTRHVPVRDIPAFLKWAKVGWSGQESVRKNPCVQEKKKRRISSVRPAGARSRYSQSWYISSTVPC